MLESSVNEFLVLLKVPASAGIVFSAQKPFGNDFPFTPAME